MVMLRAPTESFPQRIIVTLLADYRAILPSEIPSAELVGILQEFDIGTDTARSALSRLVKRGLLMRLKSGRETRVALSSEGLRFIEEDQHRILQFGQPRQWTGEWTLAVFSIPESERQKRHAIKTRFRALGFAPLYDGVWIAAFATPEDATGALREAQVQDSDVFRASFDGDSNRIDSLREKWEVDELRADYMHFIDLYEPLTDTRLATSLSDAASLITRTRLMDTWRTFPRREPDLPSVFLPEQWPMPHAREVFRSVYSFLQPAAEARIGQLLSASPRT